MMEMTLKMMRLLSVLVMFFLFNTVAYANGVECQKDNESLQAMPKSLLTFTRIDGSTHEVVVKTADNNASRAAGFQYVCAETIAAEPILFIFEKPVTPQFHMNNVVAALDIAFIEPSGKIESIQRMNPYLLILLTKPLYGPDKPSVAALETYPGFYKDHNVGSDTSVSWRPL